MNIETLDGTSRLQFGTELTIFQAARLYEQIKDLDKPLHLKLDLSKVEEVDGAGLQLLLALKNDSDSCELVGASTSANEALELMNLKPLFGVSDEA